MFFFKKRDYFISFHYINENGILGLGDTVLSVTGYFSKDTISVIRDHLKKENNFREVVILNFIKL